MAPMVVALRLPVSILHLLPHCPLLPNFLSSCDRDQCYHLHSRCHRASSVQGQKDFAESIQRGGGDRLHRHPRHLGKTRPAGGDLRMRACKSPVSGCDTIDPGRSTSSIVLTRSHNGILNHLHYANAIRCLKDRSLPGCQQLLKYYLSDI